MQESAVQSGGKVVEACKPRNGGLHQAKRLIVKVRGRETERLLKLQDLYLRSPVLPPFGVGHCY